MPIQTTMAGVSVKNNIIVKHIHFGWETQHQDVKFTDFTDSLKLLRNLSSYHQPFHKKFINKLFYKILTWRVDVCKQMINNIITIISLMNIYKYW